MNVSAVAIVAYKIKAMKYKYFNIIMFINEFQFILSIKFGTVILSTKFVIVKIISPVLNNMTLKIDQITLYLKY